MAKRLSEPPWTYEDIGASFLFVVSLTTLIRVAVRVHLLPRSELIVPGLALQGFVVACLDGALYTILKLHDHGPVIRELDGKRPLDSILYSR